VCNNESLPRDGEMTPSNHNPGNTNLTNSLFSFDVEGSLSYVFGPSYKVNWLTIVSTIFNL